MSRVRLRGIYATALTNRLHETDEFDVVDPSPVIDRRFDTTFDDGVAAATVDMTADRQGIDITGAPDVVEDLAARLETIAIDTFAWNAVAPKGAIFETSIDHTIRGGAVISLGEDRTGFLPFDDTEEYLDEGDTVRVQVKEPRPPWADDRLVLGSKIVAAGGLATLVRDVDALVVGHTGNRTNQELARTTEMLPTSVPSNWGVRWEYGASDADMDTLEEALSRAVDRAERIESALAGEDNMGEASPDVPVRIVAPDATTWIWFGRESRFALDEDRSAVTETLPGHHRIKGGSEGASTAVDFVERIGTVVDGFPFGALTDVFGPTEGDSVGIRHGKPDGRCLTLGRGTVTDRSIEKRRITVRREMTTSGTYDALGTEKSPGDVAITRFAEGRWWYPTVYRDDDGTGKGTYVNVATPVEIFPTDVRYLDLHVDVVKRPDGEIEVVDEDELEDAVEAGRVSDALAEKASTVADTVANALESD
ncbi:MAG: DUF402 domain-containing protein [Halodesulfurarchaeum sp.]